MKHTVDHGFEIDGNGKVEKFVTIELDGTYHTLLHAPEDGLPVLSHDSLMVGFLKSRDIAPQEADVSVKTLQQYGDYCMGGGRNVDGVMEWSSTTLQHALGRHRPMEEALADRLIEEVREYVRSLL